MGSLRFSEVSIFDFFCAGCWQVCSSEQSHGLSCVGNYRHLALLSLSQEFLGAIMAS